MTIADLTAYASSKYHIEEEHKWNDFPGFSVLVNPFTGKWAALLMRKWDQNTGSGQSTYRETFEEDLQPAECGFCQCSR